MAERYPAWTVRVDSPRIRRMDAPANRWWSGEGDLVFEGQTWRGATWPGGGSLMDVGPATFTAGMPSGRLVIRVAVGSRDALQAFSTDFGAVDVQVGWLQRESRFAPWQRVPRYAEGWLGQGRLRGGELHIEVDTDLGDIDRGVPEWWSHETADPGDLYAEQAQEIAEAHEDPWPPFS